MAAPIEVTISKATEADFPEIRRVEDAAFSDAALLELMFPNLSDPSIVNTQAIARNLEIFRTDPTAHYTVARLPSGEIVGFGKWNFFLTPESVAGPQHPWPMDFGPDANNEMIRFFFGALDEKRNNWMRKGVKEGGPGKRHMLMAILAVSPEHQRKLIGKRLLEWGLKQADREGVECWIDASPAGLGLYLKMGWKEVDVLDVDLGNWGGEKGNIKRNVNMVRMPQGVKKAE